MTCDTCIELQSELVASVERMVRAIAMVREAARFHADADESGDYTFAILRPAREDCDIARERYLMHRSAHGECPTRQAQNSLLPAGK
jgi:hypothetical protein